ncbi:MULTISPECIES: acyl-CoA dehydrogenase family protein [Burkholderia]|uniref:Acyl-CoA dehydrogenase n=1 Tax=Burkholderia pseudomultivorans TaxID=1207504 RepID=A0ABU2E9U7_9BURK|nr:MULTISPECIES: acyl-CoA dehydrogenase family protein [Burkholderia]EED99753.1 acyl-CoA dehydrogenase [Burkholderia multivorans CGD1]MBR8428625.1 acyl-CoA/acyl-ACP dehydrogenase [Burkholderia cenocepacia]MBU9370014.1 acyl-CoA/acyl-ACP dehydrogenase [Burkholderia multivorans]MDN7669398.1 acyl-CoA dehydrogenase family protein [Burkholderia vietnamiensis]MDR8730500.1 Acyl-CoA dehydrogenase [Burkholderia pseudomultivorans]
MTLMNTFGLSEEQHMMRESILTLLERHLPWERVRKMDEAKEYPHEAHAALAEAGFLGLFYPEELGGSGGTYKDITVLLETLGYYYTGIAQGITTTAVYAGMHVAKFGSDALKQEIIPKIISGKAKLSLAMSEPGTGSDVAGIRTTAIRDGDEYVLNGSKVWITCAHVADYIVVIAKTDRDAPRHQGISTILVDAKAPGVTIRPLNMLGRRTTHANEVFFDNVRVPASNLFGGEGQAWKNIMKCLGLERMALAAISAGHCFRITEYASDYAKQRIQFDQPISSFQVIQHKLVNMAIMAETSRQSVYRVAELLDGGNPAINETSIAKIVCTENNFRCADEGLQILGGAGYSMEYDMQMFFRDSRVGPIGGGSNEIQRNVLAKRMGL